MREISKMNFYISKKQKVCRALARIRGRALQCL